MCVIPQAVPGFATLTVNVILHEMLEIICYSRFILPPSVEDWGTRLPAILVWLLLIS